MRLVTHVIAASREIRLRRQIADIERVVLSLPARVRADLQQMVRREMSQRADDETTLGTGGHGPDPGLAGARAEDPLIAARGVAQWIAAVYHETLGSRRPGMDELHRQILRLMRQIKELSAVGQPHAATRWPTPGALA